ncbi:glycosyltransferase family 4 protein [Eionea flava]
MLNIHSIHIVRRFGTVGGMENYVFQLAKALLRRGQSVTIVCETNECEDTDAWCEYENFRIIALGNRFSKPRWLAQWCFSRRVLAHARLYSVSGSVVWHSHERTSIHHVTTFHGPPFLMRKRKYLDFLSPRIHMWKWLEYRELHGVQVQAIFPNSPMIAQQLSTLYPKVADKIAPPVYPGVEKHFSSIKRLQDGRMVVGFLGREWRRKGLDIACSILGSLRELLPEIHFLVAGCDPEEVDVLFQHWPKESYTLLGWIGETEEFLSKIDLLLHPARSEPFGMVVAEANAAGIPVVVSEHCGVAALIDEKQGFVCDLNAEAPDLACWVAACYQCLVGDLTVERLALTWDGLAQQHIALYEKVVSER